MRSRQLPIEHLVEIVSRLCSVPSDAVPIDQPLANLGLTSLGAVTLAAELESEFRAPISPTVLWRHPTIAQLAAYLAGRVPREEYVPGGDGAPSDPIAIVGIGCRFPGAQNHSAFFDLLCAGVNPIRTPPPDRSGLDNYYSPDPEAPGKFLSRWGGFLDGLDRFDASFFRMSPREAAQLDPRQRLVLETTWEALEDAGMRPLSLSGSNTAVFVATLASNYGSLIFDRHLEVVDVYSGTGNANSVVANRLSYFFDFRGPSMAVDTACSGSLVALHLACQSLHAGECALAIAGGVNVILKPDESVFFSKAGALAADGACRVFDRKASGIVRSEGAGVVVLKRLSRAIADGDRVYAQVLATAVNQDGASNGIMAPSAVSQERLLRDAYRKARISAGDVQFVEAHGTGTPLGDPIEVNALASVLAEGRASDQRCALGSVKSNIGHSEAASGMAGVIKAALSIHHRTIPGNLHFDEPNPLIPFDDIPIYVQDRTGPWPRPDRPLVSGVSSFGFAGTNAHLVLAESPRTKPASIPHGPYLIPISARHEGGLRTLAASYAEALVAGAEPAGLAHGAATLRDHFDQRAAFLGGSAEELRQRLEAFAGESRISGGTWAGARARRGPPLLAWLFPGQGSQWATMGRTLFTRHEAFRKAIERCDDHYRALSSRSLIAELARDVEDSNIDQPDVAQPAIVAVQLALAATWESFGLRPTIVLGQSLGEVAAACVAGAISYGDAMRIAWERSLLMGRFDGKGRTAAVGLATDRVAAAVEGGEVGVAGRLAPNLTLVSGPSDEVDRYLSAWRDAGTFVKPLPGVAVALHGEGLKAVAGELEAALGGVTPRATDVPFVATSTGSVVAGEEADAAFWRRSFLHPFDFVAPMEEVLERGIRHFLEISPHPVLAAPLQDVAAGHHATLSYVSSMRRGCDEQSSLSEAVGQLYCSGFDPDWEAVFGGRAPVTTLPTYPWRREHHWFNELVEDSPGADFGAPDRNVPEVHPLLGRPLHVAAANPTTRVWESRVTTHRPASLRGHLVQGTAVVPGMAFAEMALAVARQLDETKQLAHIVVRNIDFLSALLLTTEHVVQTVAETGPDGATVRVLSRPAESSDWTLHARADLAWSAGNPATSPVVPPRQLLPDGAPVDADRHYERLQEIGLTYAGTFRTLRAIRAGANEAVARVEVPAEEGAQWVCHPAMLDGFLQLVVAAGSPGDDSFRLPVRVDDLRLLHPLPDSVWCHVTLRGEQPFEDDVLLADVTVLGDDGCVHARVNGVAFNRLTSEASAVRADIRRWLYDVDWQPHPGTSLPRPRVALEAFTEAAMKPEDEAPLVRHDLSHIFDDLVVAYTVQAMSELGVEWHPGTRLGGDRAAAYGVAERHRRFWARLLEILEEAGVVDGAGVVRRLPPRITAVELVARIQHHHPAAAVELALVRRGGENLARVLIGEVDPVSQLFADGGDRLLEQLYGDTVWMRYYNAAIATAVASAAEAMADRRPLRVIEVGAGTGATTDYVLAALEGRDCEYWFTDLAPTLLARAERKFAGHEGMRYQTLDIEREPASHGMPVEHFDVVLAANVVHATTDLRRTLANLHALARPGGWVVLLEGSGRQPWLDIIVGGTDGWWKFDDDVRDRYPLLPPSEWTQLLADAGFDDTATVTGPGDAPPQFVTVSRRAVRGQDAADFRWMIVGPGGPFDLALAGALGRRGAACVTCRSADEVADELRRPGEAWRILFTRAVAAPSWRDLSDELLRGAEEDCVYGAVDVLQAAMRAAAPGRLWLVTRGAQPVGDGAPVELAQTPIWGIGRVAAVELPETWGGLVDLDPERERDEADHVIAEVLSEAGEDQVARRAGRWLVPRLIRSDPAAPLGDGIRIRPDGAYLVTGGLRGIGLAVAGWLADRGARRLVLLSRTRLPPRGEWRHLPDRHPLKAEVEAVRSLEAKGAEVILAAVDVADRAELEAFLVQYAEEDRPPIRGVVHSAGLISDALLAQLDRATFARVTRAKIQGSWLLHELLGGAGTDFMVLFSSGTSLLGTFGQANYAAANAFVDALAHHRRAFGRPATAINWGVWQSIGIVARMDGQAQLVESGLIEITPQLGLEALDRILRLDPAQIAAMPTDWHRFREIHPRGRERPLFKALLDEDAPGSSLMAQRGAEIDALRAIADLEARRAGVRGYVAGRISEVMRLDRHDLDDDIPLNNLGMDSIMAATIRDALENDLGASVAIIELLEGATMADLVDRGCAALDGATLERHDASGPLEDGRFPVLPSRSGPLRCSPAQETLWFVEDVNRARVPMYNVPVATSFRERLDAATLRAALAQVTARHETLRTSFGWHDLRPHQFVHENVDVQLECEDLAGVAPDQQERRARELATEFAARPFDLTLPPLARFLLVQKSHSCLLVLNIHHLVFDGWSAGILVEEVAERYEALAGGTARPVAPPAVQFADYAAWLSDRRDERDRDVRWFAERLPARWEAMELPVDYPRPVRPTFAGAKLAFEIEPSLTTAVHELARMGHTTPFSVLTAALGALLRLEGAQRDVVIATTPSHRLRPETAELIGYFVNTLLLPLSLDTGQPFLSLIAQVRETTLGALAHASAPLEDVLATVRERQGDVPPVQVVLTLQNSPMRLPEIIERFETIDNGSAKFELVLNVVVSGDRLECWWEYATDRFRRETVAGLADRFVRLLGLVCADPHLDLGQLLPRVQPPRRPLPMHDEGAEFSLPPSGTLA